MKTNTRLRAACGVLPAEPGWRVVFRNDPEGEICFADIVGWEWVMCDAGPAHGDAVVVAGENAFIESASEFLRSLGPGWRITQVLRPNAHPRTLAVDEICEAARARGEALVTGES